jgi:feruloyl esterase
MAPGMGHCTGGPGLNTLDTLGALQTWVERGIPPDELLASHTTLPFPVSVETTTPGDFSRSLCPYPQAAQWTGRGSATDAANFVCH